MTAREAAAAALAVRWYAVDHNGQLPAKLEDLVPAYLPRLPRDYQADNQPLKYRAGQDAILWSVGEDGIDSGGRERDPTKSAAEERGKYDEVFPLTARPRKAAN
jgi:hypothetical protein